MSSAANETALGWFTRLDCPSLCIGTGHPELDRLLGNSIPLKAVTEILGDERTGKIQLAMTILAELLLSKDKTRYRPLVLDYNGSFRPSRLLEIIKCRLKRNGNEQHRDPVELLERVEIIEVRSLNELEKCLIYLKNEFPKRSKTVPFVLINKIGAILFETALIDDAEEGSLRQDRILQLMRTFCSSQGATFLITNHFVYWRGYPTPSLGLTWKKGIVNRLILNKNPADESLSVMFERNNLTHDVRIPYQIGTDGFGPKSQ